MKRQTRLVHRVVGVAAVVAMPRSRTPGALPCPTIPTRCGSFWCHKSETSGERICQGSTGQVDGPRKVGRRRTTRRSREGVVVKKLTSRCYSPASVAGSRRRTRTTGGAALRPTACGARGSGGHARLALASSARRRFRPAGRFYVRSAGRRERVLVAMTTILGVVLTVLALLFFAYAWLTK